MSYPQQMLRLCPSVSVYRPSVYCFFSTTYHNLNTLYPQQRNKNRHHGNINNNIIISGVSCCHSFVYHVVHVEFFVPRLSPIGTRQIVSCSCVWLSVGRKLGEARGIWGCGWEDRNGELASDR